MEERVSLGGILLGDVLRVILGYTLKLKTVKGERNDGRVSSQRDPDRRN